MVNQKGIASLLIVLVLMAGIGVAVYLSGKTQVFKPKATENPTSKLLMADFYWWYPWYGGHYLKTLRPDCPRPGGDGIACFPDNVNGNLDQTVFGYEFSNPIPFLYSDERKGLGGSAIGRHDDNAAKDWFKGNFERAAGAGIQVLTPMSRPDLAEWPNAIKLMVQAQRELKAEGKIYPKLMFHLDGIEYWDGNPNGQLGGQLTGPGSDFNQVSDGTIITFTAVNQALAGEPVTDYFYTYPDSNTFPMFVYRIEGNERNWTASDWWIVQLKLNFKTIFGQDKNLYVIPDSLWCSPNGYPNSPTIRPATCNGDNYYTWGGAYHGAQVSTKAKSPKIYTVGPGFKNISYPSLGGPDRNNGVFYQTNLDQAKNSGADWILLETFNFGEEGTAIDTTTSFGNQYLDLTRNFAQSWTGFVPPPSLSPSPAFNIADLNKNGKVDIFDFNLFVGDYQSHNLRSDLNHNNQVDIFDFNTLVANFGK